MARMIRMALLAVAIASTYAGANAGTILGRAQGCGLGQAACAVALGEYRVAVPDTKAAGPAHPALVFFHGAGGSSADVLGDADLVREFTGHGYVVIAPEGLVRQPWGHAGWYFRPNEPAKRDELAFIREVMADAVPRFHINRARVLLGGMSIGGSLTWYLACRAPREFAAYAPVAGGFWDPMPEKCAGPVKLLHTHGWRDETVPLEGRMVRTRAVQADIFAGLGLWRRMNGCVAQQPTTMQAEGTIWRRSWSSCAPGTALEFVLHDGGHEVPDWWAAMARAWFEKVVP